MKGYLDTKVERVCKLCKKSFLAHHIRQRYCGAPGEKDTCAWYRRRKESRQRLQLMYDFKNTYNREGSERELSQFAPWWRFAKKERKMWTKL